MGENLWSSGCDPDAWKGQRAAESPVINPGDREIPSWSCVELPGKGCSCSSGCSNVQESYLDPWNRTFAFRRESLWGESRVWLCPWWGIDLVMLRFVQRSWSLVLPGWHFPYLFALCLALHFYVLAAGQTLLSQQLHWPIQSHWAQLRC